MKIINKLKLKYYSLVSQLLIVIGVLAIVFIAIIMPLIETNTKDVIANQMYERIKNSQDMYTWKNSNNDVDNEDIPQNIFNAQIDKSNGVYHNLYYSTDNQFNYSFKEHDIKDLYQYVFGNDLETIKKKDKSNKDNICITGKGIRNNKTYYYRILYVGKTSTSVYVDNSFTSITYDYLISITTSETSDSLLSAINNNITYIIYAYLFAIFVTLIIWVVSLIKPLNKIKDYVDDLKNRKESYLDLNNRKDEIGIVGEAIVDMNHNLKKQEKAKEEMIHNISHDLKTPIALIKNYSQAVKDDIYPYGDKDSTIDVIIENADRLENKVKSLLYLNRLDYQTSQEVDNSIINMKELIIHTTSQMQTLKQINFNLDLEDIEFIGDSDHWRVVIENIIDNACRYVKNEIKITLKEDYLEIYNDGDPIDVNHIEDLFDPYVKGVKGQFGLGLAIVSKTAHMYGYNVKAENKDVGVSFIFTKKASH